MRFGTAACKDLRDECSKLKNNKCKDPEAGMSLECSGNKTSVSRPESSRQRGTASEIGMGRI